MPTTPSIRPPVAVVSGKGSPPQSLDLSPLVSEEDLTRKPDPSAVIRPLEEDDGTSPAGDQEEDNPLEGDIDDIDEQAVAGVLYVYKPECLSCGHLVAFAKKKRMPCHVSEGNQECPAQSVTIVINLNTEPAVQRVLAAEAQGNLESLIAFYKKVGELPEWKRNQYIKALNEARVERARIQSRKS